MSGRKWKLPNGSKANKTNWLRYLKGLENKKVCRGCDELRFGMEFVRNCKSGRLKSICSECFKAGILPKKGLNGKLFTKSGQPGSKIPPPENQANRTKGNAELEGTFPVLPKKDSNVENGTFSKLGLSDTEAKLAGELLGKKRSRGR